MKAPGSLSSLGWKYLCRFQHLSNCRLAWVCRLQCCISSTHSKSQKWECHRTCQQRCQGAEVAVENLYGPHLPHQAPKSAFQLPPRHQRVVHGLFPRPCLAGKLSDSHALWSSPVLQRPITLFMGLAHCLYN